MTVDMAGSVIANGKLILLSDMGYWAIRCILLRRNLILMQNRMAMLLSIIIIILRTMRFWGFVPASLRLLLAHICSANSELNICAGRQWRSGGNVT